jgi:hypothetical protein
MFYLAYIVNILLGIGGGIIHLWTAYIIFTMKGIIWGLISLCLPFVSQVYLIILGYGISHTLLTKYSIVIFTYAIGGILLKVIIAVSAPKEDIL